MDKHAKIYVAGHRGLMGSAIFEALAREGYANVVTRTHTELELCDQSATYAFFQDEKPQYVFLAAAKVGGIAANDRYPADFIMQNLMIQVNIINACLRYGVQRLLFLGSNCMYPRDNPQPIMEDSLLSGPPERTNEAFAVAKIAGAMACRALNRQYGTRYLCAVPTNLYGPNDNFSPQESHVLPGLMRRMHDAKEKGEAAVTVWGTGLAKRTFIHSEDAAKACLLLMNEEHTDDMVNIAGVDEITIRELAHMIKHAVGFGGDLIFDASKPDGNPQKRLDGSKLIALGWKPMIALEEGILRTYEWYLSNTGRQTC